MLEDQKRWDRIRLLLGVRLKTVIWPGKPPTELWLVIAGFLVRVCPIVTGQDLVYQETVSDSLVDLSQNVYARYVKIDGISYIRGVRNCLPSKVESGERLLLKVQDRSEKWTIHIRLDLLGVRYISVSPPRISYNIPGLWWRQLSLPKWIKNLKVVTDVRPTKKTIIPHARLLIL